MRQHTTINNVVKRDDNDIPTAAEQAEMDAIRQQIYDERAASESSDKRNQYREPRKFSLREVGQ